LYEFRSYADWQKVPVVALTNVPKAEFAGCKELLKDQLKVSDYLYKPTTNLRALLNSVRDQMPTRHQTVVKKSRAIDPSTMLPEPV
jgi:hypothetical protein